MIDRATIESLVPHAGAMCLWDTVVAWDTQTIVLRTDGHRDPHHPLRSHGMLRALHLSEYGAQAMAVHGGLLARERAATAAPGMLVALRGVELHCTRIDDLDGPLECVAESLVAGEGAQQYRFTLRHQGVVLAEGRAAVMLRLPGTDE
ncbi:3-hydroxydecanoyl-[ACP] dehydratase [Lysobacter dokdonensis DS-58]|uniref:3-hydroxydecanoyl-[ACP] dehydratase n=1 Tax=Lysobacter dokdonensis DS-58 TaxID=1300345 RepID=A0A0A2WH45_9GAMM|nr:phosphotransferase [Lysobacter dokdonensis]KGQ19088.1 3-hydroxydecanoyl-[ACP] dehydratase [Lysobacter dokdonensis DS-58]